MRHTQFKRWGFVLAAALICGAAAAEPAVSSPVVSWRKSGGGALVQTQTGVLELQVWSPRVIRVRFRPADGPAAAKSLSVIGAPQPAAWRLSSDSQDLTLATGFLQAKVSRKDGAVRFTDLHGNALLSEQPGGRTLTPVTLPGPVPEAAFRSEQDFVYPADESVYGLGQHQSGDLDYRGDNVLLEQANREIAIPFLVSSRGYGLFWDNPASTTVSVGAGEEGVIPAAQLFTDDGAPGGLTGRYFQGANFETPVTTHADPQIDFNWNTTPPPGMPHDQYSVRWTGFLEAEEAGEYTLITAADDGTRLWVDDRLMIDDWTAHAVKRNTVRIRFDAYSRHRIRLEYFQGGGGAAVQFAWQHPPHASTLAWKSEASDGIDYYVLYGPALDHVIASYQDLTGKAPMPGKWALGYWQSKERYNTQQEWLDIAREYRARREPIDNLVQDWFYWDPYPWGSHRFDPKRYPNPAAAIRELHDKHLHFMISVWGKFRKGTPDNPNANYEALQAKGFLYSEALNDYGPEAFYDAFNPEARALYWRQLKTQIFDRGVDAWWLDASEPEINFQKWRSVPTAAGLAARVLNAWPLAHTGGLYKSLRAAAPRRRVFILTRSAYAGQQRNAAAAWSGDITASWHTLAVQIPAGLNFCLSGIPYWTTDIGAFFVPRDIYPGGSSNPAYRELFTRWFQYGAFCPIFRVHGTDTAKELWRFGPATEKILVKYDNLRYRLMPYLYAQAWQVTSRSSTLMRALVMDFPQDRTARSLTDEYLFGPAILVAPVTQAGATSRNVYLPDGVAWTDFWTGRSYRGGQTISSPAPIDTLPLYVKAGAIVPMGPYLQYAAEKPADPIELRVYPGAGGSCTLYEDDGLSYDYEHGAYATIPITWNDATHRLTIGKRRGAYPGMLARRTFRIVWVRPGQGAGLEPAAQADRIVLYSGRALTVPQESKNLKETQNR